MWLFYFLIVLILIFSFVFPQKDHKASRLYLVLMFSVIGFLLMFHSADVGNDTQTYVDLFRGIAFVDRLNVYIENSRFEVGYIYLNRFLSFLSTDPQILFIVTGFFTAISFARFFYHYSEMPWLSVLMFMTLQFYDLSLSGIRQILAIAILLFAYDFLIKRKFWPFLIIVLLASTIHTSAILFLILYPLTNAKFTKLFYVISGAVGLFMYFFFPFVIRVLDGIFPQYVKYFTDDGVSYSTSATLAVVLMLALWVVLFLLAQSTNYMRSNQDDPAERIKVAKDKRIWVNFPEETEKVLKMSIWISILMLFLALQGTILNRFKYIFSAAMLVYYPNMLNRVSSKADKTILVAGSCVVFIIYILIIYKYRPEWQSSYPYTFCWE